MPIIKHKNKITKAILALVISLFFLSGTGYSSKTLLGQITQTELVCINKRKADQTVVYCNPAKYNKRIIYFLDRVLALVHLSNLVKVSINQLFSQRFNTSPCFLNSLHLIPQTSDEEDFISKTG